MKSDSELILHRKPKQSFKFGSLFHGFFFEAYSLADVSQGSDVFRLSLIASSIGCRTNSGPSARNPSAVQGSKHSSIGGRFPMLSWTIEALLVCFRGFRNLDVDPRALRPHETVQQAVGKLRWCHFYRTLISSCLAVMQIVFFDEFESPRI